MDAFRNNLQTAFKHSVDYDIDEAREAIERKLQYITNSFGRERMFKQRDFPKPFERNLDYSAFLDETIRRNGLTPRGQYTEPMIQKKEDTDSEITNSRSDEKRSNRPVPALYHCEFCGESFNIKSLLIAHRRSHDEELRARMKPARQVVENPKRANQCEYCDRSFDLERTLHIHQLKHCSKIPPRIRRSLDLSVLQHENKAPLPHFHKLKMEPAKIAAQPVKKTVTFMI